MNYKKLVSLHNGLIEQYAAALRDNDWGDYRLANQKFSLALIQADEDIAIVKEQLAVSNSNPCQDPELEKVELLYEELIKLRDKIKQQKAISDKRCLSELRVGVEDLVHDVKVKENRSIVEEYEHRYRLLLNLKKQKLPLIGVEDELNAFLVKVNQLRKNNSVSLPLLTQAMDVAYDRLTGGSKEKFDAFVKDLYDKHSIPLKILGGTLIVLGAALIISAIFFAPAMFTAASIGLGTIYAASAGAAAVSTALTVGGTACFFAKTKTMELVEAERQLDHANIEAQAYRPAVLAY